MLDILGYMKDFIGSLDIMERFFHPNGMYSLIDAAVYSGMIRKYNPKRIIEIGSGYSTFAALDTNTNWMKSQKVEITCIEPYPERLKSKLMEHDQINIIEDFVQNVNLKMFEALEAGDILFIDSSHVAKCGGDVPFEYFEILPRLKNGVIIHIHDIHYPFVYRYNWLTAGKGYDEIFILRALLTNNPDYEVLLFNDMMIKDKRNDSYYGGLCVAPKDINGGSIWIEKK